MHKIILGGGRGGGKGGEGDQEDHSSYVPQARFDRKGKDTFKIYDVKLNWKANNYNINCGPTHTYTPIHIHPHLSPNSYIHQYLPKSSQKKIHSPTHTQTQPKKVSTTHSHPHFAKKSHTLPHPPTHN